MLFYLRLSRKSLLSTLFVLFQGCFLSIATAQERTVPAILSLWNPVATTPYDSLTRTPFNLGIQSTTQEVDGLSLNILAHANKGNHSGLQISGFTALTKENMSGVQISSLYNATGKYMRGVQVSGLLNTAVERAYGAQIALVTNFIIGDGRGVQLAALTNIAGSRFRGMQLAAGVNVVSSSVKMLQLSGITNICADTLRGTQISIGNYASVLNGVQVGLINICGGERKGMQIGLVNRSSDSSMVKIGLVNINPKTRVSALLYAGSATKLNLGFRFSNNHLYTMLGVATHYYDFNSDFSGALFYRAGYEWTLIPNRLFISSDLGYAHVENFENDATTPERMYSLQARVNLEYRLNKHLGFIGSGGYLYTHCYTGSYEDNKPLAELGIVLTK